ncbi:MAG: trypsin-like peptidase domain-containing protein [Chloroflexota bacterium]|nr:trypsin-like peptidase domain-containing protein [Chloroflexota bacterium]
MFFALLVALAACSLQSAPPTMPLAVPSTPVAALNVAFAAQVITPTAVSQALIDAADAEYTLLTNLYARLSPSVVNLDVQLDTPHPGIGDRVSGSGFVYDMDGHIVTNAHVVDGAREVQVTFADGYVAAAEVVGADSYSDLAVVRVDAGQDRVRERLSALIIGDSDAVRVGERAIAIGNPFGLNSSMTVGIVSGLGRQLPSAELIDNAIGGFRNPAIIQVDTDINPGNSGGPLFNSRGEVIGVNTAIRSESGVFAGVGFAVPSRTVERVVPELIAAGRVDYAWIGISAPSADDGFGVAGLAEALNLPVDNGVLIASITPGSPAALAGLQGGTAETFVRGERICTGGDIIVAVDGRYVHTMDELVAHLVVNTRPGQTVNLLVVRGGETFDLPVVLTARPSDEAAVATPACG